MSSEFLEAERRARKFQKELLAVYKKAQKEINARILQYRADDKKNFGLKRPSAIRNERLRQQEQLLLQVKKSALDIRIKMNSGLSKNIKATIENAFYRVAYKVDQFVIKLKGGTAGFALLPDKVVEAALSEEVAGHTFKDRTLQQQRELQYRVRTATSQAIAEGIGEKEFYNRLLSVDKAYMTGSARAQATARTEILRAYSIGQDQATQDAEALGVKGSTIWNASLDDRTRSSHRQMDGVKRNKDGFFTLPNGEKARYPRDPNLSAGQSINCRCEAMFLVNDIKPTKRFSRLTEEEGKAMDEKEVGKTKAYENWKKGA